MPQLYKHKQNDHHNCTSVWNSYLEWQLPLTAVGVHWLSHWMRLFLTQCLYFGQIAVFSVGWSQELGSKKLTGKVQSLAQRSLLDSTRQQHQYTVSSVLETKWISSYCAPAFMLKGLHSFLPLRATSNGGWHCLICLWPVSLVEDGIRKAVRIC